VEEGVRVIGLGVCADRLNNASPIICYN
jgi:hypothetical protein